MFGVDYYPEHWPRHRWKSDAILMEKAGFEVVRLAEFAWEKIEPDDGVFEFSWLDDAIEVLGAHGLKVVLGTPTAAPPAWLVEKHQNILPVRRDGTRLGFGGRHHDCQSNEIYRESVEIIVRAMATHYRDNLRVIGWQIDNELGNSHSDLCYCDSCRYHFHAWLQRKYGTIDALNDAWGTVFWSQTYTHFSQIPLPVATPNAHNPGLLLDWRRFASDLIADYQETQVTIIREECPHHVVTHNFMGFSGKTDYYELGKQLDFVSHDQYPLGFWQDDVACPEAAVLAMPLDFIRGVNPAPFWIMEQQTGPAGWEVLGPTPRPGQLKLWAAQAVSRGADTVVFFRWRTCLVGTEQYWHGILPHSGNPGRRYDEIAETVSELEPILESVSSDRIARGRVAILFSYDQMWAFEIQPHHPEMTYLAVLQRYYDAFHRVNVPVDFVGIHDEFVTYDLVVAPMMYLVDDELAAKCRAYVENGGHLVSGMRTGVKDWNNRVLPETLPGPFARMFGIRVTDYDALRGVDQTVKLGDVEEDVSLWADIIETDGARPLANYTKDFYASTPAITEYDWESGVTYYVGTVLGPRTMDAFVSHVLERAGIHGVLATPEGVEAVARRGDRGEVLFVLNHTNQAQIVAIPAGWRALLGAKSAPNDEDLVLPAFGVAAYEQTVN